MAAQNPTVDTSFISQFERDVHMAYQRQGSQLRGTIRNKSNINGKDTTFQKIGKGTAGTKSRHGKVPVMNLDHSAITVTLTDHYAGEWIDDLDELKLNIDERMIAAASGAWALGRKTDELIVTALEATSNTSITGITITNGLKEADVAKLVATFGNADVPDDGQRMGCLGWQQWGHLMQLDVFTSADYIGQGSLPSLGSQSAKFWNTFVWMPSSALTQASNKTNCLFYHKTAAGHASGKDVSCTMSWENTYSSFFSNCRMSQGVANIDTNAIYQLDFADTLS
jgi:hypothetical protein